MKAQRGSRDIALLFLLPGIGRGWSSMPHPSCLTPGKETRFPMYRKLVRSHGQSGWVRRILPAPGLDPQTDQQAASSYTDYITPAHHRTLIYNIFVSCCEFQNLPKQWMHLSSPPYMLHAQPISFFLIWPPE